MISLYHSPRSGRGGSSRGPPPPETLEATGGRERRTGGGEGVLLPAPRRCPRRCPRHVLTEGAVAVDPGEVPQPGVAALSSGRGGGAHAGGPRRWWAVGCGAMLLICMGVADSPPFGPAWQPGQGVGNSPARGRASRNLNTRLIHFWQEVDQLSANPEGTPRDTRRGQATPPDGWRGPRAPCAKRRVRPRYRSLRGGRG